MNLNRIVIKQKGLHAVVTINHQIQLRLLVTELAVHPYQTALHNHSPMIGVLGDATILLDGITHFGETAPPVSLPVLRWPILTQRLSNANR